MYWNTNGNQISVTQNCEFNCEQQLGERPQSGLEAFDYSLRHKKCVDNCIGMTTTSGIDISGLQGQQLTSPDLPSGPPGRPLSPLPDYRPGMSAQTKLIIGGAVLVAAFIGYRMIKK